jgi:hypothetical protein
LQQRELVAIFPAAIFGAFKSSALEAPDVTTHALCYSATLRTFITGYVGKARSGGVMHSFRQYVTCCVHTKFGPKRWKVSDHPKQS